MGATDIIKFSPHIPNNVPAVKLLVAPEGKWHPDSDGTWPVHPFAYDRWEKEELSWYNTSYIHAGLNPFMEYQVKGKELLDLMECISVNTFRKFPVGKARHTIICGEDGKIIIDGIIIRRSEDEFICACLPDPAMFNAQMGNRFKIETEYVGEKHFFFQFCEQNLCRLLRKHAVRICMI